MRPALIILITTIGLPVQKLKYEVNVMTKKGLKGKSL